MSEFAVAALAAGLALLALLPFAGAFVLFRRNCALAGENAELAARAGALTDECATLRRRVGVVVDAEAERQRVVAEIDDARRAAAVGFDAERTKVAAEIDERRRRADAEIAAERQRVVGEVRAERARLEVDVIRMREQQAIVERGLQDAHQRGQDEARAAAAQITRLRSELAGLEEEAHLLEIGFYRPRYDFADSMIYQGRLELVRDRQKQLIKSKAAAVCHTEWTVNGSRTAGRKQTDQTLRLMLRAFNGECDAAIAKVKYNNVAVMEARIRKSFEKINASVQIQTCSITAEYRECKLVELYLVHEYQEKVQAEREEQRQIREQMREEEIARRELERAEQDAIKEAARYAAALERARADVALAEGEKQRKLADQIDTLELRLAEAEAKRQRAIAQAQLTRSGHVYVISNVGSFGENVYKIGMTRRLDPMDRVRELGDASVPFLFDVHAIIWSEDAPGLENALHRAFDHRRVNMVNHRKEFFRVSLDEVAGVVRSRHGEIEFTLAAEAKEYRQTVALLREAAESGGLAALAGAGPTNAPVG